MRLDMLAALAHFAISLYFHPYIYDGFRCKKGESNLSLTRVLLLLYYENKFIHFLTQQSSNFLA